MSETKTASITGFSTILDGNKSKMASIEKYKNTKLTNTPRNVIFAGITIVGLLMFIVFATQIITGMFALILTGVTVVGGFIGLRWLKAMDPVIRQKTRNAQLKFMIDEAKAEAIYQLDNQVIANGRRLAEAKQARDKMGALVATLKKKINPEKVGTAIHTKKTESLAKVQLAYDNLKEGLRKSYEVDEAFKVKVAEYRDMDAFSNLANEALALLDTGDDELEEMLSLAAFDSIDSSFNESMIALENTTEDMLMES